MSPLVLVLPLALISGLIGAVLGSSRRRSRAGFWLSVFLGPFGWILVFFLPKKEAAPARGRFSAPTPQPQPEFARRWYNPPPEPPPSGLDVGSILLGLIAIAICTVFLVKKKDSPSPPPLVSVPGSIAPASPISAPATGPHAAPAPAAPQLHPEDLFIVRGFVTSVNTDGLVIQCYNYPGFPLPPSKSNPAEVARISNAAAMGKDPFGDLMGVRGGVLQPVDWDLAQWASGSVLVTGHPLQSDYFPGRFLKIAAANVPSTTGISAYTMSYSLAPDPPGTWMWQRAGRTSLEEPAKKIRRR